MNAVPKPEPLRRVKSRRKRAHMTARKSCRATRYQRAGGCCEVCGVPWSLGGDPTGVENTRLLCPKHHGKAHGR
jgi:hypothetical protein